MCVNTGVCASHLCLVLPHVHWNQMCAGIWNFKASRGSGEWHSLETTDLESMAPSRVCGRGGGNLKSTRLWNPCRRAVSSAFLICVGSGLDPPPVHLGRPFTPELCWTELRLMELTMLCIWGEGCSVFLTETRNKKCYTEGEHSSVKRIHVLEAFSGLKYAASPVGIRVIIIPDPVYLVFLKR